MATKLGFMIEDFSRDEEGFWHYVGVERDIRDMKVAREHLLRVIESKYEGFPLSRDYHEESWSLTTWERIGNGRRRMNYPEDKRAQLIKKVSLRRTEALIGMEEYHFNEFIKLFKRKARKWWW
jgi:hypothetical protein